jgi:hypothetical protein
VRFITDIKTSIIFERGQCVQGNVEDVAVSSLKVVPRCNKDNYKETCKAHMFEVTAFSYF